MIRWKKKVRLDYKEGDIRIVRRFLWWPVCLDDEWRWLGIALIKQRLELRGCFNPGAMTTAMLKWVSKEWVDGR